MWADVPDDRRMTPELLATCRGAEWPGWLEMKVEGLRNPRCLLAVEFWPSKVPDQVRYMPCGRNPCPPFDLCASHGGPSTRSLQENEDRLRAIIARTAAPPGVLWVAPPGWNAWMEWPRVRMGVYCPACRHEWDDHVVDDGADRIVCRGCRWSYPSTICIGMIPARSPEAVEPRAVAWSAEYPACIEMSRFELVDVIVEHLADRREWPW